eukprot:scaffold53176_cov20-Tisochrysis_lutea.AAC.2
MQHSNDANTSSGVSTAFGAGQVRDNATPNRGTAFRAAQVRNNGTPKEVELDSGCSTEALKQTFRSVRALPLGLPRKINSISSEVDMLRIGTASGAGQPQALARWGTYHPNKKRGGSRNVEEMSQQAATRKGSRSGGHAMDACAETPQSELRWSMHAVAQTGVPCLRYRIMSAVRYGMLSAIGCRMLNAAGYRMLRIVRYRMPVAVRYRMLSAVRYWMLSVVSQDETGAHYFHIMQSTGREQQSETASYSTA